MKTKQVDWTDIYNSESGKLLAVLRRYVSDIQVAEDILHESFIKAMQAIESYKNKGAFEAWLKQITIHTALDYIKNIKKQTFVDVDETAIADESTNTLANSNRKDNIQNADFSKEELLDIIDQLPTNQKSVFNLHVIDGYSHKEISSILSITENVSKTTLSRTRKKVQELLHEKAAKKINKKKKRRGVFALMSTATFSSANAMDKLFQNAFKNDFITTTTPLGSISPQFQHILNQAKPLLIKSSIGIVKTGAIILAGATTAACVTYSIVDNNTNTIADENITTEEIMITTELIPNAVIFDTIKEINTKTTNSNTKTNTKEKPISAKKIELTTYKKDDNTKKNNTFALQTAKVLDSVPKPVIVDKDQIDTIQDVVSKKQVVIKKKVYIKR